VQRERQTEQARQTTQNKMAAFLNAAASGRLWTDCTSKTPSDKTDAECTSDGKAADVPKVRFIALNLNYQLHLFIFIISAVSVFITCCFLLHRNGGIEQSCYFEVNLSSVNYSDVESCGFFDSMFSKE